MATSSPAAALTAGEEPSLLQVLARVSGLLEASAAVPVSADPDSAAVAGSGEVAVDVPVDPSDGVSVSGDAGLDATLALPGAARAEDASRVAAGVVGFEGSAPSTDLAVQVLADGVRAMAVLRGQEAPTRLAFPLGLAPETRLEPDGSGFRVLDLAGQPVGFIDPAWALDAVGNRVPARYEAQGTSLTLVVEHNGLTSSGAPVQYPVVADPTMRGAGSTDPQGGSGQLTGQGADPAGAGGSTFGCGAAVHEVDNTTCHGGSVNSRTGEFVASDVDLTRPGRGLAFDFTRAYRSARTTPGPLGPGWTHSYNARLAIEAGGSVTLDSGDGKTQLFTKQADGSFTAEVNGRSQLRTFSTTGYEVVRPDQVVYRFDMSGRLVNIYDRARNSAGNKINVMAFSYDSGGQLTAVRDAVGRTFTFSYNSGLLSRVAAPAGDGRAVSFGYTGGRLSAVTDVRGGVTRMTYDSAGRILTVTDPRGNAAVTNTYATSGRVATQTDALGAETTFAWNATSLVSTMTDALGHAFTDDYTGVLLAAQTTPIGAQEGYRTTYGYDARANRIKVTDGLGHVVDSKFDANRNRTSQTNDAGAATETETSATYDTSNNLLTATDAAGQVTTFGYDTAGQLTSQTGPDAAVTAFGRDTAGSGLLVSQTDPRNHKSTYGYSTAALPGTGPSGELTSMTTPLLGKTTMTHDGAGRVTSTVTPRGNASGANPATYRSSTTYDAAGNVLTRTAPPTPASPTGAKTTYTWDANGNRTSITDARGFTTTYTYDALNRLASVTAPNVAAGTRYGYDEVGNLVTRKDAKSHVTTYGYDADRRLLRVANPLGSRFSYSYDAANNLRAVADANGNATDTNGDGVTSYTYDSRNRVTRITYADGTPTVTYTYNARGDRETMTDGAGKQTYGYDPKTGRLTSITRVPTGLTTGPAFSYAYDTSGNIIRRTYPDGAAVTYTYDNDGRMSTVTAGGKVTRYGYLPDGLLRTTTLPNGYLETRDYDPAGRLTSLVNAKAGVTLSQALYQYDASGNPTRVETEDEVSTYTYNGWNMLTFACYTAPCDSTSTTTDAYIKYVYDRVGNRVSKERPIGGAAEITTYEYDAADQLTLKDGPSGTCSNYAYDANGNQLRECGIAWAYNDANKPVSAIQSVNGSTQRYTYDGDGNRLTASTGNTAASTTEYTWDTNHPLPQLALETDGAGTLLRRYTHGLDTISMTAHGGDFYYHHDGLGSVIDVTSSSGAAQHEYAYEAFGDPRRSQSTAGAPANPLRYSGEYYDTFTDTYHLRARQYDTHLGRFTQTDPAPGRVTAPTLSTYVYAANQPTKSVDPSGRYCTSVPDSQTLVYDFSSACAAHDVCYSEQSDTQLGCDVAFFGDMLLSCDDSGILDDELCEVYASLYYQGVRAFGESFYEAASGETSLG